MTDSRLPTPDSRLVYIAQVGLNYPQGKGEARVEIGEQVPPAVVARAPWLVDQGYVSVATPLPPHPGIPGLGPTHRAPTREVG